MLIKIFAILIIVLFLIIPIFLIRTIFIWYKKFKHRKSHMRKSRMNFSILKGVIQKY